MNEKNIYITGGSGFIGSNICRVLLKKNLQVYTYNITV